MNSIAGGSSVRGHLLLACFLFLQSRLERFALLPNIGKHLTEHRCAPYTRQPPISGAVVRDATGHSAAIASATPPTAATTAVTPVRLYVLLRTLASQLRGEGAALIFRHLPRVGDKGLPDGVAPTASDVRGPGAIGLFGGRLSGANRGHSLAAVRRG